MFKKIFLILLAGLGMGLFAVLNVTKAVEPDIIFDSEEGFEDPVTGDWIQPFEIKEDGTVKMLTLEEYKSIIELEDDEEYFEIVKDENAFEILNFRTYYKFKPSGNRTKVTKSGIKATADINCNTPTCSATVGVSATTSRSYSVSGSQEIKAINANAGYTVTKSATNSSTFNYNIKKGDRGYISFKPYHWKVSGKLELRGNQGMGLISSKNASVTFPKKLSDGQADGIYSFVYTKRGK
ncbi:DUF6060 domain-containing protein [Salipaludibacillus agaradhaerens]|uniref:DUF6060 domain-containing protein n=1 Tax=Salipaludibacillus agaradhaerens TaxID=76935 RepID=UPI000998D243|nr:hypothetical protein [Salipaludibacillus agaradhaerens]